MNKKLLSMSTVAVAAALAAGSTAYACAPLNGAISVKFGDDTTPCTDGSVPQPNTSGHCDIDVNSASGSRKMMASAEGTLPNQEFYLWFLNDAARDADSMQTCMDSVGAKHVTEKTAANPDGTGVGASVTSDANGDIAEITRYIPARIDHGFFWPEQSLLHGTGTHNSTASVCFMDGTATYATEDVTFIVTGGPAGNT